MTTTAKISVVQTGRVLELDYYEGMTVRQALEQAEFNLRATAEVRLNNNPCTDLDTVLGAGDQVMIVGHVRGA